MIYHITNRSLWSKAEQAGVYQNPSLFNEGFIHFSTKAQVIGAANRYYSKAQNLLLLKVDETRLESRLIWENTTGGIEPFPHLYGVLNLDAVAGMAILGRDIQGLYKFPHFQNQ